ncbi:MAG: TIGR03960 family B12-binding radical SAM protein, partial [Deltaproteobacteria bacterium]|nr:TIGR03960 family B12-binding radical SAM protein [Deltaproteobacteria bacterium]
MSFPSWPELAEELRGVERPARYLGSEPGANPGVWPDENGFILRIALAFPEVYEIAHSHLGHKILYHLFNGQRGFSAERAYAPWPDYEKRLGPNRPLRSLESRAPLSDFHVVGFSLQYELSYTNILNMLALGGLNPLAAERPEGAPLVVAGGPGAANPEPLADFFDLFFLGEAEDSWLGDFAVIKDWARAKAPKAELFARLAGRPGVYLPALYEPQYEKGRFIGVRPLGPAGPSVPPAKVASLSRAPFPLCQIVPWVKPVHDRVVVEIARGCARGCRFCQAGYLYRPVRERGAQEILDLTEKNLLATGYDEAAFLSLSAGDHSQIEPLVASFMNRWANSKVALSLPSLRVKSLSRELASQISRTRKTGFTIAPEAATARLRAVINKDLSEDDLFAACETAFSLGWRTIKLYFMSGLPTETDEDLWAMGDLAGRLKKLSKAQINLSVATFVPKAHTPFQWQKASSEEDCSRRLKALSNLAKKPGLAFRYGSAEASLIEAVLARGDRRLGRVVQAVWGLGARFEAWNENLKASYWKEALSRQGFAVPELLAAKDPHGPLPWGHLGPNVSQDFLLRELAKAGRAEVTLDCRQGGCQGCGACQAVPMSLAAAGPTGPALAVSPGQALAADPSQTLSPANPWAPSDLNLDQKSQSSA